MVYLIYISNNELDNDLLVLRISYIFRLFHRKSYTELILQALYSHSYSHPNNSREPLNILRIAEKLISHKNHPISFMKIQPAFFDIFYCVITHKLFTDLRSYIIYKTFPVCLISKRASHIRSNPIVVALLFDVVLVDVVFNNFDFSCGEWQCIAATLSAI